MFASESGNGIASAIAELSRGADAARIAENRAAAESLRACYALYQECRRAGATGDCSDPRPDHAVLNPFDVCSGHVTAIFSISTGRAETMISFAVDLTERYPAILEALGQGRLDMHMARFLARQMRTVDPSVVHRVQREVVDDYLNAIENGERPTAGALRDSIDAIIRRSDADGVRRRRDEAARDRGVTVRKEGDGMSSVRATLTSDEAAVLVERLDQHATSACVGSERLSPRERRADALVSLACGDATDPDPTSEATDSTASEADGAGTTDYLDGSGNDAGDSDSQAGDSDSQAGATGGTGATGATGSTGGPIVLRPRVTVIAHGDGSEATVLFPRTGESSVLALLEMLAASAGATLERLDPTLGASDDLDRAHEYRPSAALDRAVRLRDGTCRHPGCSAPAEFGDLDHMVPFDHADPTRGGPTLERNAVILCRRHHRFKTFSGWGYHLSPDGTLVVTTPDGKRMITRPSGPLARFRREEQAASAAAESAAASDLPGPLPPEPSPDPEPTYWQRRAQRIRAERRAVADARERAQAQSRHRAQDREPTRRRPPGREPARTSRPRGRATCTATESVIEQRIAELLATPAA